MDQLFGQIKHFQKVTLGFWELDGDFHTFFAFVFFVFFLDKQTIYSSTKCIRLINNANNC